jgi:hypothetical protein
VQEVFLNLPQPVRNVVQAHTQLLVQPLVLHVELVLIAVMLVLLLAQLHQLVQI